MISKRQIYMYLVLFPISIQLVSCQETSVIDISLPSSALKYNEEEFRKFVPKRNHYVLFYAPWNGDCNNVARLWEELAFHFHPNPDKDVVFAKVDCTKETKLCAEHSITNFPTPILFKNGSDPLGRHYFGPINLRKIELFMHNSLNITDSVIKAQTSMPIWGLHSLFDEIFNNSINNVNVSRAFVCFCTPWSSKCMDLILIWKDLAKEFRFEHGFVVGLVDCTISKRTCDNNNVVEYPSLFWIQNGTVIDKYHSRDRSLESLRLWVLKKLGKNVVAPTPFCKKPEPLEISAEMLFQAKDEKQMLFINFGTPWCSACNELYATWDDLQFYFDPSNYKGPKILIQIFDCSRKRQACDELQVKDYPTLNFYKDGRLYDRYTGDLQINSLIAYVENIIDHNNEI